jgi:hypothetical protein
VDADAPGPQRGGARADGDGSRGQAEAGAGPHAHPDLRGDDADAAGADEKRRADRPVPDLAGDRHRAEQGGQERSDDLARVEQLKLPGGAVEGPGGQAEAVQEFGEQDEAEHRGEQAEVGAGRALFEQLGA